MRPLRLMLSSLLTLTLWSCAVEAVGQVVTAPLVTAQKNGNDVLLSWQPVPNATGYNIYRSDMPQGPFQLIGQLPTLNFTDAEAVPGPPDEYFYVVRGEDALGEGPTSNMAFKFSYRVQGGNVLLALPFLYVPLGALPPVTAEDLCQDHENIVTVTDLGIPCAGMPWTHHCGSPITDFELVPGVGLWVSVTMDTTLDIVGSHDPEYEPGGSSSLPILACSDCNILGLNQLAIPYHAVADTAESLCQELAAAGTPIHAVEDRVAELSVVVDHFCGTSAKDFPLVRGRLYWVITYTDVTWQPEVW